MARAKDDGEDVLALVANPSCAGSGFSSDGGAVAIAGETRAARADTPSKATGDDVVAESDDVRALVAPLALYPDPILALVLQASTLPLQVVQADRFLDKRLKDASLQPDPDWDKPIVAQPTAPSPVDVRIHRPDGGTR